MPLLLGLIPEIIDAIIGFIAAGGWWQIPVSIGLSKVVDAATQPTPAAGQPETPVQAVVGAVGGVAHGAGGVAAGVGSAASGLGDLFKNNMPLVIGGGLAALFILGRR